MDKGYKQTVGRKVKNKRLSNKPTVLLRQWCEEMHFSIAAGNMDRCDLHGEPSGSMLLIRNGLAAPCRELGRIFVI